MGSPLVSEIGQPGIFGNSFILSPLFRVALPMDTLALRFYHAYGSVIANNRLLSYHKNQQTDCFIEQFLKIVASLASYAILETAPGWTTTGGKAFEDQQSAR